MGDFHWPEAVCFDLDDTLIDFSANSVSAWNEACELASGVTPYLDPRALALEVLRVRDWYWSDADRHAVKRQNLRAASAEIVSMALANVGVEAGDELPRQIAERYRDLRDEAQVLMPGALESLARLRLQGVGMALVTNGSQADQRRKIERFGLAPYFDHIQIEGEFGLGKPHEPVYRHVIEQMGIQPQRSWFVGDNLEWDVLAPQRVGFTGIWVDYEGTGLPSGAPGRPHRTLRAVSELLVELQEE